MPARNHTASATHDGTKSISTGNLQSGAQNREGYGCRETGQEPSRSHHLIGLRDQNIVANADRFLCFFASESTKTSSAYWRSGKLTACATETASQVHRNVSATLRFAEEFSMRSFIDSPCEN